MKEVAQQLTVQRWRKICGEQGVTGELREGHGWSMFVARPVPSVHLEGVNPRMAAARLASYATGWGRTEVSV